jgi:reactive chlorine resistance protein C
MVNQTISKVAEVRGTVDSPSWAPLLLRAGGVVLRYSLVLFLLLFGALKWTTKEAQDIEVWVVHSPFIFWVHGLFGTQGGSEFIGVLELAIGGLIAARPQWPKASAFGSLGAALMFLITLSFLFTTPEVGEAAGFLMKDLTLLGAALWTAGEALSAANASAATPRRR